MHNALKLLINQLLNCLQRWPERMSGRILTTEMYNETTNAEIVNKIE